MYTTDIIWVSILYWSRLRLFWKLKWDTMIHVNLCIQHWEHFLNYFTDINRNVLYFSFLDCKKMKMKILSITYIELFYNLYNLRVDRIIGTLKNTYVCRKHLHYQNAIIFYRIYDKYIFLFNRYQLIIMIISYISI